MFSTRKNSQTELTEGNCAVLKPQNTNLTLLVVRIATQFYELWVHARTDCLLKKQNIIFNESLIASLQTLHTKIAAIVLDNVHWSYQRVLHEVFFCMTKGKLEMRYNRTEKAA